MKFEHVRLWIGAVASVAVSVLVHPTTQTAADAPIIISGDKEEQRPLLGEFTFYRDSPEAFRITWRTDNRNTVSSGPARALSWRWRRVPRSQRPESQTRPLDR